MHSVGCIRHRFVLASPKKVCVSSLTHLTEDLAAQIKARRIARNLSQAEAAEMLGVSERTFQNWEAGATFPWPRHRRAIAAFLADEVAA